MRLYVSLLVFILTILISCSPEIDPSNPYDPESPKTIRAKGELIGSILPEDTSDLNKTNFTVTLKETSYNALVERNGNFSIKDVEPGIYTLRVVSSDSAYYDTEIGPINIGIGQKTNIGIINLSLKKGSVKGFVKRADEKNNTPIGVGKVKVTLFSNEKKSSYLPLSSSSICNDNSTGRIYYSISEPDGSFTISNVRVGTYRINSYDEIYGLGISGSDIEIKENTVSDAGTITLLPPSALIRIEDEKISGKVISVTNSEKVKVIFFYGDFLKEFKLSINESFDNTEWKELGQDRAATIELSKGEGLYNIFIKFRDIFCRETPIYSSTVFLDKTAPVLKNISLPETNNDFINSPNIKVNLSVSDNYSDYNSLFMRKIIVDESETSGLNIDSTFFENRKISYESYKGEFVEPIAGKSGKKVFLLQFKDEAGNESEVIIKEFYFDNVIPEIDITIDGAKSINGTDTVNSNYVNLKIKNIAPNKVADIEKVKVFFGSENEPQNWDIFREMYPVVLPLKNGVLDIKVKAMDRAGNISNLFTKKIAVDTLPPQINSIIVNNNKKYTKSNLVSIEFNGQDISEMLISNNYKFNGSNWVQYESFLPDYDIGSSEGIHNIYFKFRDSIGNETDVFIKDLILDTTPPCSPENINISNSKFSTQKNRYYTNVSTPLISWQYLCGNESEIEKYKVEVYKNYNIIYTTETLNNNILIPYIQDGEYSVKVYAVDRAGNSSPSATDIFMVIDTIPPSSPKLKKIEYTKINLPEHPSCQFLGYIDIDIPVLPDDENITDFKFQISGGYDENCFYINWFTDIKDLPNQLIDEDTVRFYIAQNDITTLMIRGVDEAGNYSDIDFITITEDSTPPTYVQNIRVENNDSKILVTWEPPLYSPDVDGYLIHYGYKYYNLNGNFANEGSSPINVKKPCSIINGKEICQFWLTGVPNATPFYVDISAYDDTKPQPNVGSITYGNILAVAGVISPDLLKEVSLNDINAEPDSKFEAVEERDGLVYVTTSNNNGNGGLHIIDVSNPTTPLLIGYIKNPEFKTMHKIKLFGRYAFVANGENGILIFDITEPNNIRLVKKISVPAETFASSLEIYKNYLLISINNPNPNPQNSSILIYNIDDIANPQYLKTLNNIPMKNIFSLAIQGNILYIGCKFQFFTVDLSDINNVIVRQVNTTGCGMDVSFDRLYTTSCTTHISVLSYSNTSGEYVEERRLSTNEISINVISEGHYLYVSTNGSLKIYHNYDKMEFLSDIKIPNYAHIRTNVLEKYQYVTQKDIKVSNTLLFMSYANDSNNQTGLKIFSLANPRNPKLIGEYFYSNMENESVSINKDVVVITSTYSVEFGRYTQTQTITRLAKDEIIFGNTKYADYYDGLLYIVTGQGIVFYDFNYNQLIKRVYPSNGFTNRKVISAIVKDNYLFVGIDKNLSDNYNCIEEIQIVDIKTLSVKKVLPIDSCTSLASYGSQNKAFAFYSNYLYAAILGKGIYIYDISDIESPVLQKVYLYNHAHVAEELAIYGRYLFFSSRNYYGGVMRLSLENPIDPQFVNMKVTTGQLLKLIPSGNFLFNGTKESLATFDFSNDDGYEYSVYNYNSYHILPAISGNFAYLSNLSRGVVILKLE